MNNEQLGISQLEANLNKGWGWDEWQEKAPEGIEAMAKYKPEIFNVLYKAKYGVAPSMSGSNGDLSSASIMGAAQLEANLNKGWGWDEWQEKAPEGIEAMAKYKPEIFNALYKAKYGVVITA